MGVFAGGPTKCVPPVLRVARKLLRRIQSVTNYIRYNTGIYKITKMYIARNLHALYDTIIIIMFTTLKILLLLLLRPYFTFICFGFKLFYFYNCVLIFYTFNVYE